jgi:glucose-6-phosphate 1-dehydrogenase
MKSPYRPDPTVFVILGAGGDLAWRKLVPALFNLFLDHWLPEKFAVIGLDRDKMSRDRFARHLREGVGRFSRRGKVDESLWKEFFSHLAYDAADFNDPKVFSDLSKRLAGREKEWNTRVNRIFYLALPPSMIEPVTEQLAKAKLNQDRKQSRIVVEKPFGHDLESAEKLNQKMAKLFRESQIFRIDHYLGKETVQNILAFRQHPF